MGKISIFILGLSIFLFFGCGKKEDFGSSMDKKIGAPAGEERLGLPKKQAQEITSSTIETITNPFLTPEEASQEVGRAIPIDYLNLSAILYSSSGSKVIINGQILSIGDNIDNKEIIKIEPEAVILKDSQAEYIIKLKEIGRK